MRFQLASVRGTEWFRVTPIWSQNRRTPSVPVDLPKLPGATVYFRAVDRDDQIGIAIV